jgi:hypothetical protein
VGEDHSERCNSPLGLGRKEMESQALKVAGIGIGKGSAHYDRFLEMSSPSDAFFVVGLPPRVGSDTGQEGFRECCLTEFVPEDKQRI